MTHAKLDLVRVRALSLGPACPFFSPASRCVTGAGVRGNFLSANLQPGCVFMQRPSDRGGGLDAAAAAAAAAKICSPAAQEERVHVAAAAAGRWETKVVVVGVGGVGKGTQHAGLLLGQRGEAPQPPLAPYISCLRCYF